MMSETSMNMDAFARYYNEVWLDQLIEEAFRLAREKTKDLKEKDE
ncbi:MAG: hypothetical protein QW505_05915 [Thermoplasmata archaeon]